MKNEVFGEVTFHCGWEQTGSIILFKKPYSIVIRIKSFRETDMITAAQERGYQLYRQHEKEYTAKVEQALLEYCGGAEQAKARFCPAALVFQRDGQFALMLDDKDDLEDGLVITLFPDFSLLTTEQYL